MDFQRLIFGNAASYIVFVFIIIIIVVVIVVIFFLYIHTYHIYIYIYFSSLLAKTFECLLRLLYLSKKKNTKKVKKNIYNRNSFRAWTILDTANFPFALCYFILSILLLSLLSLLFYLT